MTSAASYVLGIGLGAHAVARPQRAQTPESVALLERVVGAVLVLWQ